MAQELGRIERPPLERFRGKRKLLLVPFMPAPPGDVEGSVAIFERYWEQMQAHVARMELQLGLVRRVYHETLAEGGDAGLDRLETADRRTHAFIRERCVAGAELVPTEDAVAFAETLDLQRCLLLPLTTETVARHLREWFDESSRRRYEHVARQIDTTLGPDEVGLLLINERHQVQFPHDVEVFFIAPPALDEYRRWLEGWWMRQQAGPAPEEPGSAE